MSYILDALRKSEHERHMSSGQNTSLMYQIEIKRNHNPWFMPTLLILAIFIALGIFWLIWTNMSATNLFVTNGSSASTIISTATPVLPVPPVQPAPPATPIPQIQAEPKPETNTVDNNLQHQVNPQVQGGYKQETLAPDYVHQNLQIPTSANDMPLRQEKEEAKQSTKPRPARNNMRSNSNPALVGMPPLTISGFVHNKVSGNLAMINNKLVHEGEEISPGLTLIKILEDSAIFSYKGYVFTR